MRKVVIELVYNESTRLQAAQAEPLGKALQDLYFAAHHYAGVDFEVARTNWKEEHSDYTSS